MGARDGRSGWAGDGRFSPGCAHSLANGWIDDGLRKRDRDRERQGERERQREREREREREKKPDEKAT